MTLDELNAWEQAIKDHGVEDIADDVLRLIAIARAAIALEADHNFQLVDSGMIFDRAECRYCGRRSLSTARINHRDDCVYAAFVKAVKAVKT